MRLSRLFIYPIKSAAGLEVESATVDEFGLAHDRRWMIVDEDRTALTQREHPRLALVRPTPTARGVEVNSQGFSSLTIDLPDGPAREVLIWADSVPARDAGSQAAQWF